MKVYVRKKPFEAATHIDVLCAVKKMQELCGSTDIVSNVLTPYFTCMIKGCEPLFSMGVSRSIAETFFDLCKLYYVQNYISENPQTAFYIPQGIWKDVGDGLRDEHLKMLKEFGCIDYEEQDNFLTPDTIDMPSKITVYKISNRTLYLQMKFAKNIFDKSNFENTEQPQKIINS